MVALVVRREDATKLPDSFEFSTVSVLYSYDHSITQHVSILLKLLFTTSRDACVPAEYTCAERPRSRGVKQVNARRSTSTGIMGSVGQT